jgi:hypothetical protein
MAVGPSSERLFPTLTEAQIHRIAAHGRRRQTTKGEVLVEIGDTAPFFVVVRGAIQVLSPTAGAETVIVMHSPGQFTGEANMMTGRRSIARSRWTFQSVDQETCPQVTGTSSTLSQPSCRRAGYRSTLSRHTNGTTALVLVLMDNRTNTRRGRMHRRHSIQDSIPAVRVEKCWSTFDIWATQAEDAGQISRRSELRILLGP